MSEPLEKLSLNKKLFQVNLDETLKVAQLMGMKTVLNEFIAYQSLAQMITDGTLAGVSRFTENYQLLSLPRRSVHLCDFQKVERPWRVDFLPCFKRFSRRLALR